MTKKRDIIKMISSVTRSVPGQKSETRRSDKKKVRDYKSYKGNQHKREVYREQP